MYSEQEAMIDTDDPLLEEFPQDRLSILAHVRSTESRLNEDETNFEAVPASPISRTKSSSPSPEEPLSTQLNGGSSPLLDIIAEERQEEDFAPLPSPSGITESRLSQEMSGIIYPDTGATSEAEPLEEAGVFRDADLTNLNQKQSAFDSISVAQDNAQDESTKQTTSIATLLDTTDKELVEQTPLITTIPEANDTDLEEQEKLIATIPETTNGELVEQEIFINTNLQAFDNELTKQEPSIPDIDQRGSTEHAASISALPETAENEIINLSTRITALPQNTESELVGKQFSIPTIPETADNGLAEPLPSITQTPGAAEDELAEDSAKSGPSNSGDRNSISDVEESPTESMVQNSRVIGVGLTMLAPVNEIAETTKDEPKKDLPELAKIDDIGGNLSSNEEEPPSDSVSSSSKTTPDHITTQALPINKLPGISINDPIVDTPTPVAPIPSDLNLVYGEALITNVGDGDDGPSILARLATPEPNAPQTIEATVIKGVDVAKSSAVEEPSSNGDSNVKMRNPANTERSVTPASLRPPGRDKETRNFLQVLWRTVFIQWIGGFFARLCGGRRRP
jgi:hypothetical protein